MAENWQFKIVRGYFETREAVESVIAEQAEHGWVFVEKFDNNRIRFKRSPEEAAKDRGRAGNPYSTTSAIANSKPVNVVGCVILVMIVIFVMAQCSRR